jgi:sodium/proline symporter
MPLLAKALVPGWMAGLMIAGATAAMMSSADSQLLVATSTLVEDIYVRLLNMKASASRLVLYSRLSTVLIAAIAFLLAIAALMGSELIDGMVAYAWTGLGASFGPPLIAALWWRRTTFAGALAGMLGGMTSAIVWKNSAALNDLLDIKAAAVVISALLVIGVSLITRPTPHEHGTQPAD